MTRPIVIAFVAVACVAGLTRPAPAFQLGAATFGSAGGVTSASPFVLGMTVGQSVTGARAGTIPPSALEGAGFWRWGHALTLGVPAPAAGTVLDWALLPVAPNPFVTRTLVRYAIPASAGEVPVRLRVYDLSGRLVRTLESGKRAAGLHAVPWDGRDDAGRALGGGMYFCRVTAGSFAATQRLVLTR